jgi:tetratricopeptide (TPR) repeat protein
MPSFNQRLGLTRYAADEAYRRALEAFAKRDYDRALMTLNEAIEALPNHPEYFAARGLIHLEEAEYDEAKADFETSLRLNKYEMLANYGLGAVAYKQKDYATAQKYFLAAYYIDQTRPETLYYLALTYYQQGDLANAANTMVRANEEFEKHNDKRKADSARWLRELSKHLAKPAGNLPNTQQPRLPLGEESG